MKCKGIIRSIDKASATVEFDASEACSKCCSCDMTKRGRSIGVGLDKVEGLKEGDAVEVEIKTASMMRIYVLLYGAPLVSFVGTMLAVYVILRNPIFSFFGALVVTIITYALIGIYMKRSTGIMPDIKVTKRLEEGKGR